MAKKVPATKVNLANPDVFQLRANFKPAINKQGESRLTFLGYEHSIGRDEKNGFIKLVFSVMDVTRKNPVNIPLIVNYNLDAENSSGKVLSSMGIEVKPIELTEDEDGFTIAATEVDYSYIYDELDSKAGFVYLAMLTQLEEKNGLYRIDYTTLKPKMNDGEQEKEAVAA